MDAIVYRLIPAPSYYAQWEILAIFGSLQNQDFGPKKVDFLDFWCIFKFLRQILKIHQKWRQNSKHQLF